MPADPTQIVTLPAGWLALIATGLVCCIWLGLRALRRMIAAGSEQPDRMTSLAAASGRPSLFHRWDPRFKLAALLLFAFCAVTLQTATTVAIALGIALAAVPAARLAWTPSLRRLLAMNGFLTMFLVVMPLTVPTLAGDTLVVFGDWDALTFNLRGLERALVLIGKAWTVALLMEPMLATAPLGATLEGLNRLGVPARFTEMLLIAHRYLFVFLGEIRRMRSGMDARAFRTNHHWDTLRDLGNFVGMLLVRSYERTQRVYNAMLARGYSGGMPHRYPFAVRGTDIALSACWLLAGLLLLGADLGLRGGG